MDKAPHNVEKIVICGTPISGNKGGAALVYGAMKAFRSVNPNLQFSLVSMNYAGDSQHNRYNIKLIDAKLWQLPAAYIFALIRWPFNKLGIDLKFLIDINPILKAYNDSDLILNMTGIGFHDFFGKVIVIKHALWLLPAFLLEKPVISYSQSLGPFESWLNKFLARHCLKRVNALVLRGETSRKYLEDLTVGRPTLVAPDVGFLLEPVSGEQLKNILDEEGIDQLSTPIIGIAVNKVIDWKLKETDNPYVRLLAQVIDDMLERLNGTAVFIPHDTHDIEIARKVIGKMKMDRQTRLVLKDYSAEELKGLIGCCDYFLASRYHSIVASLSMGVPTMVIGWSHKYKEVMDLFGQSELIVDFEQLDINVLGTKINDFITNHDVLQKTLKSRIHEVREKARKSAEFVQMSIRDIAIL